MWKFHQDYFFHDYIDRIKCSKNIFQWNEVKITEISENLNFKSSCKWIHHHVATRFNPSPDWLVTHPLVVCLIFNFSWFAIFTLAWHPTERREKSKSQRWRRFQTGDDEAGVGLCAQNLMSCRSVYFLSRSLNNFICFRYLDWDVLGWKWEGCQMPMHKRRVKMISKLIKKHENHKNKY